MLNYKKGRVFFRAVVVQRRSMLRGIFDTPNFQTDIRIEQWMVQKATPKGAWLVLGNPDFYIERKWLTQKTRYVQATREDAEAALLKRKHYHLKKLEERTLAVREVIDLLELRNAERSR